MAEGYMPVPPYHSGFIEISDCNDADIPGRCYIATGATTNRPTTAWYFIQCFGTYGVMKAQLAITLNTTTPSVWVRTNTNTGTWGNWIQIALAS